MEQREPWEKKSPFSALSVYQRILLLLLLVMIAAFTGLTFWFYGHPGLACVGLEGKKALLVRSQAGETVRYSGKLDGENAEFSVTGDTVTYRWGEETYGPYQVKRDPTARPPYDPENPWPSGQMGVEVRREGKVVFRGGYAPPVRMYSGHLDNPLADALDDIWENGLVWEDGSDYNDWTPGIYAATSTGEIISLSGSAADHTVHQPRLYTVIQLVMGPQLYQRGSWTDYIKATALAVFTVLYVLLYKQLLQARMNWLVKDGEQVQPSDVSILAALVAMLLLTGAVLLCYLLPLTKLTPV